MTIFYMTVKIICIINEYTLFLNDIILRCNITFNSFYATKQNIIS